MPVVRVALLLVLACWISFAAPPAGYYIPAEGKTGTALRQALHTIIRNHTVIPYSSSSRFDTSDALKILDEDAGNTNNVILLYAQRSEPKSTFGLTTGWNREHMWPNSYGLDDVEPAFSDLHNLRAEDANVNSARGNDFFDETSTTDPPVRIPGHTEAGQTSSDSNSWEPPDSVKGDIARALFYMDVRYEGSSGEPNLILTEVSSHINSSNTFMGKLSALLFWHYADPVSPAERQRNDLVHTRYQNNRNPFIDHPEWVDAVFRPALRIARLTNAVEISWEIGFSNAHLEVRGLHGWAGVETVKTNSGALWIIREPAFGSTSIFRLR